MYIQGVMERNTCTVEVHVNVYKMYMKTEYLPPGGSDGQVVVYGDFEERYTCIHVQ